MADLRKIRCGDRLRFEVTVTQLDMGDSYPIQIEHRLWLDTETVLAAEHIPAPKVFKRGDWVQYDDQRHGWVNYVKGGDVLVAWPEATQLFAYTPEELEPDEAPE